MYANDGPTASRMRRRFYHLGVEREAPPPYLTEDLLGEGTVAYVPQPAVGQNPQQEAWRRQTFNATSSPPPKPKYVSDIDRCRHFVQPRGGVNVEGHLVHRPSYLLSQGGPPAAMYSASYRDMLRYSAEQLHTTDERIQELRGRSTASLRSGSRPTTLTGAAIPASRASLSLPLGDDDGLHDSARPDSVGVPLVGPKPSGTISVERHRRTRGEERNSTHHHSGAAAVSPSFSEHLPTISSPSPDGASFRTAVAAVGSMSPTSSSSHQRRPLSRSSFEVANEGTVHYAAEMVRQRYRQKVNDRELRHLTRMGHPNQLTVYLPAD